MHMNGINKYSVLTVETWEPEDAGSIYQLIKEKEKKEAEEKKKEKEKDDSGKYYHL